MTELWERRDELAPDDRDARAVIASVVEQLDRGEVRAAEISAAGEMIVLVSARASAEER